MKDLASRLGEGVQLGAGDSAQIRGVASLTEATPADLAMVSEGQFLGHLATTRAGVLLGHTAFRDALSENGRPFLTSDNPAEALQAILEMMYPEVSPPPGIHSTAWIHPDARVAADATVGPFAAIEAHSVVGAGASVGAHCVIGANARVGEGSVLYPHVVLYPGAIVGARVRIHSGARIGVDGFGYRFDGKAHQRVPQVGGCILEDDVEIGANTCIDRGSTGVTRIGAGSKIDNQVHFGHNVTLGPLGIVVAQAGVSGSCRLGTGVILGGQAGIAGHLQIGDGARVAAQAGVIGDVEGGSTVMGFPARPQQEFLRAAASQYKVPDLLRRMRALEKQLAALTDGIAEQDELTSS